VSRIFRTVCRFIASGYNLLVPVQVQMLFLLNGVKDVCIAVDNRQHVMCIHAFIFKIN
jgi:hypothetical protein